MSDRDRSEAKRAAEIASLRRRLTELEGENNSRIQPAKGLTTNGIRVPLGMAAMEQSREGLVVVDLKGDLLFVNNSFAAMHGYTPTEILGKNLSIFHTPEQMPAVESANRELRETGEFTGELWHVRRGGEIFPGLMHNSLLRDEDGEVIGMIGTLIDATELMQAKEALRKSEEQYRLLIDNADVFVSVYNYEGICLLMNKVVAKGFGGAPDDFVGKSMQELHPDNADEYTARIREVIDSAAPREYEDVVAFPVETRCLLSNVQPMRDAAGEVTAAMIISYDITERKQAEEQRLTHLRFLKNMESIDRAIRGTTDPDKMLSDVIATVLSILECDRAWLLYPCDPDCPTMRVPIEATRPEYPGACALDREFQMAPSMVEDCRLALATDGPVACGPGCAQPMGKDTNEQFSVQSQMFMALYPQLGSPWLLGVHQCSHARLWTDEEQTLLTEIGRRITDSLSSLLSLRNLKQSEERFRTLVANIPGVVYRSNHAQNPGMQFISDTIEEISGYPSSDFIENRVRSYRSIIHPADLPEVKKRVRQGLVDDTPFALEYRIIHTNGNVRWVYEKGQGIRDESGEIAYIDGALFDITDRKYAEAALRHSEEKFRGLYENAQIGMFRTRVEDGLFLEVNQRLTEMLGYSTREEVIGRVAAKDLEESESRQRLLAELKAKGEVRNFECRIKRKDNSFLWVRFSGILHAEQGYFEGVAADITEYKLAEEALVESERLFRAVFNQTYQFIGILTTDGTIIAANNTARKFAGVDESKILGRPFWETPWWSHSEKQRQKLREAIEAAAAGRYMRFETTHPTPNGELINVDFSLTPIKDEKGNVILLIPEGRDITERKQTEEELSATRGMLEAAIAHSPAGILIADAPDVTIRLANPAAFGIRGGDTSILTGIDLERHATNWQTYRPNGEPYPSEALPLSRAVLRGEETHDEEIIIRDNQSRDHWVSANAAPIRDEAGQITSGIVVFHDITERKKAEAEKEKLEAQLRHAQKMEAVGQLAGGVAHDFNNILTTIMGNVELSLDTIKEQLPQNADLRSGLEQVERAAGRAAALTRQLLVFSRRDVLHPDVLDLNNTLREMEKMLRRLITEDISLITHAAPNLRQLRADAGQIEQVIMNLAVNARDAMPEGGQLTLETNNVDLDEAYAATHAEANIGPHVLLTVSDNGCGIDAKITERIFEPFYTTKPVGQGTGLGLATAYAIIKRAGGHIMVYSEVGLGTTFKVYLPAIDEPAGIEAVQIQDLDAPSGTETILICEDDDNVRDLTAHILTDAGYHVLKAANGPAAIKLAAAHQSTIELLISDVIMPIMNGKQLSDVLVATRPSLRTLYMSGYTSNLIAHHGVLDEGVEFLEKPFSRRNLLKRVRTILDLAPKIRP